MLAQHAVASAHEAVAADEAQIKAGGLRLGVIVCMMAGNVTYSRRLYEEVLRNPATASPLLFPETVLNAAASHLGAYLGTTAVNYTVLGDDGTFLQGLALGADWLEHDLADACVVVGAEEMDWLVADAIRLFERKAVYSAGAGAIYLKRQPSAVELTAITDSFLFTQTQSRADAARRMRAQLPPGTADDLLIADGENGATGWDEWPGQRLAVSPVLGKSLGASAAFKCVVACDSLQHSRCAAAIVPVVGVNQQAIGARFAKSGRV